MPAKPKPRGAFEVFAIAPRTCNVTTRVCADAMYAVTRDDMPSVVVMSCGNHLTRGIDTVARASEPPALSVTVHVRPA